MVLRVFIKMKETLGEEKIQPRIHNRGFARDGNLNGADEKQGRQKAALKPYVATGKAEKSPASTEKLPRRTKGNRAANSFWRKSGS